MTNRSSPGTSATPVGTWSYKAGQFGPFMLWQQTESGPHYVGSVNSQASAEFIVERLNGPAQTAGPDGAECYYALMGLTSYVLANFPRSDQWIQGGRPVVTDARGVLARYDDPSDVSPVTSTDQRPFYGAECPSYPNCIGGCGLGCTKKIETQRSSNLRGDKC